MAQANRRGGNRRLPPIGLPAGDERREAMAQVADTLAEEAETNGVEREAINPAKLRVENELAQHFNILDVTNADPMYAYSWVYLGQHGLQIKMKLADGWEVVQGESPEAIELKGMGGDTTRKLGDVMLMRIRRDFKMRLDRRERLKRERQEEGVAAQFEEILRPYQKYGATAIVDGRDVMSGEMVDAKRLDHMWKRSQASARGSQIVDKMLRDGRMPGAPAPVGA